MTAAFCLSQYSWALVKSNNKKPTRMVESCIKQQRLRAFMPKMSFICPSRGRDVNSWTNKKKCKFVIYQNAIDRQVENAMERIQPNRSENNNKMNEICMMWQTPVKICSISGIPNAPQMDRFRFLFIIFLWLLIFSSFDRLISDRALRAKHNVCAYTHTSLGCW